MKKIFSKSVFITICMILVNQSLLAQADSVSCTFFMYPKASVGCHTYISYQGNAGSSATFYWNFDGGVIISGSGQGPYIVKWDTVGLKTVSLYVSYIGQTCSSSHTIHIVPSPTFYSVTGGGSYPQGGPGVHIGLSGSQVNYNYYLFLNGTTQSIANKTGTGSALDFGLFTAPGVYTCKGKVDSSSSMCFVNMNDSAVVFISGYVPGQYICMVSYDTTYNRNKIIWNKIAGQHLTHYNIYRQTYQFDVFSKIAEVPYSSFSIYLDTTANPAMMAYKYKISATDSLNNESLLSPFHKTIHLEVSPGIIGYNLIWNPYEGFPFSTYKIHRKLATGPWQVIDSIASDLISYTDSYITSGLAYYFIEVIRPYPCYPSLKSDQYESAVSNIGTSAPLGIDDNSPAPILIYPNPVHQTLNIILTGSGGNDSNLQLFTMEGRKLMDKNLFHNRNELDISNLPSGLYFVRIREDQSTVVRKIFKE